MASEKNNLIKNALKINNIQISIGKIITEAEEEILKGPTPKPNLADFRKWDYVLLSRYKPLYAPLCDECCLCTFGKCDLLGKEGACGINAKTQQARMMLLTCLMGTAAHAAHARHLLDNLIEEFGHDHPIDLGNNINVEAPIIRTVYGKEPKVLGDLKKVIEYVEKEMSHLLAACHTGQEGNHLDYESKAFHAGLMDEVAKEVADICQIVTLNLPKGEEDTELIDLGLGTIDKEKPVILCVGHNVLPGADIIDYLEENNLEDKVEVCGICCTAIDMSRYNSSAKIVGPLSKQLRFIRSGIADVVIVDEQCVRADILDEALKKDSLVIATTDKICLGLPDMTKEDPDVIVSKLVKREIKGALILDPKKIGEVAVKAAIKVSKLRKNIKRLLDEKEIIEKAKKCIKCGLCDKACPNNFPVMDAIVSASKGDLSKLEKLCIELCYTCGRCEQVCKRNLPIVSMITKAGERFVKKEKFKIRAGRGPVQDVEIRRVGAPIVFGEIPGVIAFVGCSNYPKGGKDVALMAEEFLKRNYIVVTTGCSAMSIAEFKDEDGKTLYEKYPARFEAGGLVNLGSCISNAHASGAAIKIANIFARKPLKGNFEEIADYILNRIGVCGVAWGAYSQKAAAIFTGLNRWGIPVILGPHSLKYRRILLGRTHDKESRQIIDLRSKKKIDGEPAPEHLLYVAETREEAEPLIAKLCIRPNDTPRGRQTKLNNYIDLYKKHYGRMPPDVHKFVRTEKDIPIVHKKEVMEFLKKKNWKPRKAPSEPSCLHYRYP